MSTANLFRNFIRGMLWLTSLGLVIFFDNAYGNRLLQDKTNGIQLATQKCPPVPTDTAISEAAIRVPTIFAARVMSSTMASEIDFGAYSPDEAGQVVNLTVRISRFYKEPHPSMINPHATIGSFYISTKEEHYRYAVAISQGPLGCLESLQPNLQGIFLVKSVSESSQYKEHHFELAGPMIPYTPFYERLIMEAVCDNCFGPIIRAIPDREHAYLSTINVTCFVRGWPLPEVSWYKDLNPIDIYSDDQQLRVKVIDTSSTSREVILQIRKILLLNNGRYTCKASTPLGTTLQSFELRVTVDKTAESKVTTVVSKLETCPPHIYYYCFNGGQCLMVKDDAQKVACHCRTGYFGNHCQYFYQSSTASVVENSDMRAELAELMQSYFSAGFCAIILCTVISIINLVLNCIKTKERNSHLTAANNHVATGMQRRLDTNHNNLNYVRVGRVNRPNSNSTYSSTADRRRSNRHAAPLPDDNIQLNLLPERHHQVAAPSCMRCY